MQHLARTGWIVVAAALAAPAVAQTGTFRSAATFSLPGQSSDATSLLATADVGSLAGPADGPTPNPRLSSTPAQQLAARAALGKCKFKPGTVDGKAEQSWASIKYTWRLEQ